MPRDAILDALKERVRQAIGQPPIAWKRIASSGLSDSILFRYQCEDQTFCVRSWQNDPARVHGIVHHWRSAYAAFDQTGDSPPADGSRKRNPFPQPVAWSSKDASQSDGGQEDARFLLELDASLWTLSEWVDGKPPSGLLTFANIVSYVVALAWIHRNTMHVGSDRSPSSSLLERRNRIRQIRSIWESRAIWNIESLQSAVPAIQRCLDQIHAELATWEFFIESSFPKPRTCHWIVRDIWHENLLVNETQEFLAIVDLGASRVDWPGLDAIRLIGSFGPWSRDEFTQLMECYCQHHPQHAIDSIAECHSLHRIGLGLSIVQWVEWLTTTPWFREPEKAQRAHRRLSELCFQWIGEFDKGKVT